MISLARPPSLHHLLCVPLQTAARTKAKQKFECRRCSCIWVRAAAPAPLRDGPLASIFRLCGKAKTSTPLMSRGVQTWLACFFFLSSGFWRKMKKKNKTKKTPCIYTVTCFSRLIHSKGNDLLSSEDKINAERAKKFYRLQLSSHLIYAPANPG